MRGVRGVRKIEERKGCDKDRGEEGVCERLRRGRGVREIEERKRCERD